MQIIEEMRRYASQKAKKEIPYEVMRNGFFFNLASAAGLKRIKYKDIDGNYRYPNFFGITMSDQGTGKDLSVDVSRKAFYGIFDNYVKVANADVQSDSAPLPTGDRTNEEQDYIIPSKYTIPLRGSIQGAMRVANFYDRANHGSLNVISSEFGAEINPETMSLLMQLWQSASSDGSINVNEKYSPVDNVPTNIIFFGSPDPFKTNRKRHEALAEAINSGYGRRTFFVWVDKPDAKEPTDEPDIEYLKEWSAQIQNLIFRGENLSFTNDAAKTLDLYRNEARENYNKKKDKINKIRYAGIEKIERLSALISLADLSLSVEPRHVEEAIKINEESLLAMKEILQPGSAYKRIYEALQGNSEGMTISEIIDEGIWFQNKKDEEYQFELLEDLCYRKNKVLKQKGKRYVIQDLETNKLDKIVLSVMSPNQDPTRAIDFIPLEVPFFGDGQTVETLVKSEKIGAFTLAHFKPTNKAVHGHRRAENFIQGQNCIAFDIDEGLALKIAMELLSPYTYIIYTTKSHRKHDNEDRFRILLPTLTKFFVTPEQHKELYENVSKLLGLPNYDVATRNVSRLWYTNPNADVYKNKADLLDVRCCIPNTERSEKVMPKLEDMDIERADKRLHGMIRWLITNTVKGSRNNNLYRYRKFLEDLGSFDVRKEVLRANAMLEEPISIGELEKTVLKGL